MFEFQCLGELPVQFQAISVRGLHASGENRGKITEMALVWVKQAWQ